MKRQLIAQTAQEWYDVAKGLNNDDEVYSLSEKLNCMEQALNHTENVLVAAIDVIKFYAENAQCYSDDCCFSITDKEDEFLKDLNRSDNNSCTK